MIRNGLLLLVSSAAFAVPVSAVTGETTLKEIMQELRRNFLEVSDGFLLDDFDRVAEGALAIAEHPRIPPAQVELVANELGPEMPVFKNFDVQVHELSLEMYKAANNGDRAAAVAAYQGMVAACFDCHAAYRERVAAALVTVEE
jgi:cytochrome c556